MDIFKIFTLESAHRLPNLPAGHKCAQIHGHSFRVEIHLSGKTDIQLGWVQDFAEIETAFQPVHEQLDHHYLNEIEGLENPTSENIAKWIWRRMKAEPGLKKVVVHETCTCGVVYQGEEE